MLLAYVCTSLASDALLIANSDHANSDHDYQRSSRLKPSLSAQDARYLTYSQRLSDHFLRRYRAIESNCHHR